MQKFILNIHIYGGLMISDSLSAIDTTPGDLTISGNADIDYSAATVAMAAGRVPKKTTILYWNALN